MSFMGTSPEEEEGLEEKPSAAKLSRKIGEKIRRDKLNNLITQLAEEIPLIKFAHRRLDKSAILRLTVSYLKLHHGLRNKSTDSKQNGLLNWFRKLTDDTLFIITPTGDILYVSDKITDITGFHQTDMIGFNIDKFVHPADVPVIMNQFPSDDSTPQRPVSDLHDSSFVPPDKSVEIFHSDHNFFFVRMLRSLKKKQVSDGSQEYELLTVRTFFEKNVSFKKGTEVWMVAVMKPYRRDPIKEVEVHMSEFTRDNEFASLHDMDSKILSLDHRASLFHGYMVSEMIGKTPFMCIHEEDMESVAFSHTVIMKDQETLATVFRINNRFNTEIYVSSRSIIVKDRWTGKPKSIVSVNTVLNTETGKRLLAEQKRKLHEHKLKEALALRSVANSPVSAEMSPNDGFTHNEDPLLPMTRTTGRSLCELYDERAKSIPELYEDSSSNCSSGSVFSEKRAFECVEEEKEKSWSGDSSCTLSPPPSSSSLSLKQCHSNRENQCKNNNVSKMCGEEKKSGSVLKDLLSREVQWGPTINSQSCFNSIPTLQTRSVPCDSQKSKSPECQKTRDSQSKDESMPLLKGILQDRLVMDKKLVQKSSRIRVNESQSPASPSRSYASQKNLAGSPVVDTRSPSLHSRSNGTVAHEINGHSPRRSAFVDSQFMSDNGASECPSPGHSGTASESRYDDSLSQVSQSSTCFDDQQSPSLWSSASDSGISSSDSTEIQSRFTYQLLDKQFMMRQVLSEQMSTLEMLRGQIECSNNNTELSPAQTQVHDSLIQRLGLVENQVETQRQLLMELEVELKSVEL